METSSNVINTVAASGADVSLTNRILQITDAPPMNYLKIVPSPIVQRSQPERATIKTVTVVLANNTEYSFLAQQIIATNDNLYPKQETIRYTSSSAATTNTTEISVALKAIFDAHGFNISCDITSTTVLTFTADAGFPIFELMAINNTVIASAQVAIAPSGTANLAITSVIAPDGTAATAIAGTSTVTVTTLAAHGLQVGDIVDIAGVATMTINGASSGQFYVASVPSSTTFTLADCVGSGTNSGTITINTVNTVIINTLAAATLTAGDHVTVTEIATMTVNGASSFTGRIRSAVSTTQFYIDNVTNNGSLNSGTIVIKPVAQKSVNFAADLSNVNGISAGNTYTSWKFLFTSPISDEAGLVAREASREHTVYVAESSNLGNYPALYTALNEDISGYLPFSTDFNDQTVLMSPVLL